MIFVIGGTGTIGRSLLAELERLEAPARVLVRSDEKAAAVAAHGFEVVRGDVEGLPELEGALEGVDSLFLLTPQHPRQTELQNAAVEAARRTGVRRIVKVSGSSAVTGDASSSWVGRAHAETERAIAESGLAYAILRPNYFMQNMLGMAERIRNGELAASFGEARLALIDARDVGAVAATILLSNGRFDERIYDLSGPESLTFAEVAERLSAALGREIRFVDTPLEVTLDGMRSRGAPDWLVEHIRQIVGVFRTNAGAAVSPDVEQILGRPPRSVDEFARDYAGPLGGRS
jgi:NAD(P)H dehydrogenase (quinone)